MPDPLAARHYFDKLRIRRKVAPGPVPYSGTSVPKHGNRTYRNFMQFVKTMYGGTEMVIGISCLVLLSFLPSGTRM